MCGIGAILTSSTTLDLSGPLSRMLAALRHRGPDAEGTQIVNLRGGRRLGLVHSRLSILDLSPAGNQPMRDEESNSWIVFNGEIYNHLQLRPRLPRARFQSTSDTETLLQGIATHGASWIDALRGMFAFVGYDGRRQELLVVRDRLGIKPIYAARVNASTWMFASEIRALLATGLIPRRMRPEAVNGYLAFGAITAPWTMVDGVESLLPGKYWRFSLADEDAPLEPEHVRYWQPPFGTAPSNITYKQAVVQVRESLVESVEQHMLSDVPVGVFLSGGVDSSALVATLTHAGIRPHTFSVRFSEREYDESPYASLVARHFHTEHVPLRIRPQAVADNFDQAMAAYDQPSIDGVNTYLLTDAIHETGIKVAISGLGGDELFAGYPYFRHARWLDHPLGRITARLALAATRVLAQRSMRVGKLSALMRNPHSRLNDYMILRELMLTPRRASLLAHRNDSQPHPIPTEQWDSLEGQALNLDVTNAMSLFELSLYMANMLLRDTDQMSMAHPVEVRVPLLDHMLVEQVAALPGSLKLSGGVSKKLLLDSLPAPLPKAIGARRKMGFVLPWEQWLRNELRAKADAILSQKDELARAGLDPAGVRTLWNAFQRSHPSIRYTDVLALIHLVEWIRRNEMSI